MILESAAADIGNMVRSDVIRKAQARNLAVKLGVKKGIAGIHLIGYRRVSRTLLLLCQFINILVKILKRNLIVCTGLMYGAGIRRFHIKFFRLA